MIAKGRIWAPIDLPSSPLSGWEVVNKDNDKEKAKDLVRYNF